MRKKSLLRLPCTIGIVSLFLSGCQLIPTEDELPSTPVIQSYESGEYMMATVMRGDLALSKSISCKYAPTQRASLSFQLGGVLMDHVYVTEGQQVKKGDLIADLKLDSLPEDIADKEYDIAVLQMKKSHLEEDYALQLERQTLELAWVSNEEREEKLQLLEENHKLQLQQIEDSIYIEEMRLEELNTELNKRRLYATIDGTVTSVLSLQDGQLYTEGLTVCSIANMSSAVFTVTGSNADYFPVGFECIVTSGGKEYDVVSVSAEDLNKEDTGKNTAYLLLSEPDLALEDGDLGTVNLTLELREDTLYLSRNVVKDVDGEKVVFVQNEEGWKVMKSVTTGLETSNYIEITGGLEEGDQVIIR